MRTLKAVSPVEMEACTDARNHLAAWIEQLKTEINVLEVRGDYAEARKRLDTFAALVRAQLVLAAPDPEGDDAHPDSDKLRINARRVRRAYERCISFSERIEMIYSELRRFIHEGRIADQDLLYAIEMICRDYDDEVENLSISWAQVHTAWRGNRDEKED